MRLSLENNQLGLSTKDRSGAGVSCRARTGVSVRRWSVRSQGFPFSRLDPPGFHRRSATHRQEPKEAPTRNGCSAAFSPSHRCWFHDDEIRTLEAPKEFRAELQHCAAQSSPMHAGGDPDRRYRPALSCSGQKVPCRWRMADERDQGRR